ncbi:hypothetical protein Dsin_022831 [Dipteronia sinensis]|uniref:Uncharacterized protein n=1 Tax=Dipteronia sinensis TaxID=43782 RepID=A0AAE0A3R1_9ROSI|nr:hypothetical protein Dsin_022831 [Dipteronia sinensis]
MGGGAAIRAAGKLTGLGVLNGGLRGGISAAPPVEQALRNVSRPAAAVVSTASSSGADVAAIQRASWEADWDFAAVEEDLMVESSPERIARVVFDVPPTLQEAKDATADLKEALDKVYLSSPEYGPVFGLPLLATSDYLETKSCISCDSKSAPVPTYAFNAFKLLSESPAVQSVVASIATDKKVWDAVMENNHLREFMMSQRNDAAIEDQESHRMFDESSSDSSPGDDTADEFGDTEDPVKEFFQNVKKSVVEMVSNVSDFFQNLFGSSPAEKTSADAGGAGGSFIENTMLASLMGLAIMVIMVVVVKRV